MMQKFPYLSKLPNLPPVESSVDWDKVYYACVVSLKLGTVVLGVADTVAECKGLASTYLFTSPDSFNAVSKLATNIMMLQFNESMVMNLSKETAKVSLYYCDARLYVAYCRYSSEEIVSAMYDCEIGVPYVRYGGILKRVNKHDVRRCFE